MKSYFNIKTPTKKKLLLIFTILDKIFVVFIMFWQFPFITSETKLDYCYQKVNILRS